MSESRELDQIQKELEVLHERSQSNKLNIASHEATCEERYNRIQQMLIASQKQHDEMHKEIQRYKSNRNRYCSLDVIIFQKIF